jgi:hypothetical protein
MERRTMKKILFAAMAAIILCSAFVGFKTIRSDAYNYIVMNPEELTVDLPIGGADLTFLYPINITTNVANVSAWECKLLWNPSVLRPVLDNESKPIIVWGTFMNGSNNCDNNRMASSGGEYIIIGQNFNNETLGITGSGWLASVNFTFVLPGATFVKVLNAKVWNNDLVKTDLSGIDGRVKCDRPHPQFWWWTNDTATKGNIALGTHGTGPLPQHTVYDGGRSLVNATTVHFTANMSYDVSNMIWNGTAYVLTGGENIVALRWEYGDGNVDVRSTAGLNFSWTTDHIYANYLKAGYLVNLTAYDSTLVSYWSSTWRFGGSSPDDTVPCWRDVGIVDVWPSLPPYQNWDEYDVDWWSYWFFDSTDYWIPHTADTYWNYNLSDYYCDPIMGYGLPTPDDRLEPAYGAFDIGSKVEAGDADIGLALSYFSQEEKFYDADEDGAYGPGDSLVYDVDDDWVYNTTNGDSLLYGFAPPQGADVYIFDYNWAYYSTLGLLSAAGMYYDADSSGGYTTGDSVYFDNNEFEVVSADANPSVRQGYEDYGVAGVWILVTANNFGSVPEKVRVNLYAIGIALKNSGTSPAFAANQVTSVELIHTWQTTITANTGSGWGLTTVWLPPDNGTYILMATIDIQDGASIKDANRADNYFVCPSPFSNIDAWNFTSGALVPSGWMNAKYMADLAKGGDGGVGSQDLAFFLSQYGNNAKATPYQAPISKP